MEILLLDNGEIELVKELEDFGPLISKYLGLSASKVFDMFADTEANYIKKSLKTDLISYEMTLDSYNYLLHDTLDGLEKLEKMLTDSKRLNRKKLLSLVRFLGDQIYNEL